MSGSCQVTDQQLCGCCEGVQTETPEVITNRPALSTISYRVGRYSTFYASMLAALSNTDLPALAPLRTRDPSDFSIAFLDTWAVVCDILSFYQQRLANEAYLRCAIDDRSVMELAALVGYKPSPGVAASTVLAFSLNSAIGAPDNVLIPTGTRVQSVPGPGETPQVFETSNDIIAVIRQNAMAVQTSISWGFSNGQTSIWIQGSNNNLNPGDTLLFINQAFHDQVTTTVTSSSAQADLHFVVSIQIDAQSQQTLVEWDQPLAWATSNDASAYLYVMRKRVGLFGSQSIDPRSLAVVTGSGLTGVTGWPQTGGTLENPATNDWDFTSVFTPPSVNLDTIYTGLVPSTKAGAEPTWVALSDPAQGIAVFSVQSAVDTSPNAFLLTNKTTQLNLANGVIVGTPPTAAPSSYLQTAVQDTRNTSVYAQSSRLVPVDPPYLPSAANWSYFSTYNIDPTLLLPVLGPNIEVLDGQQLSAGQRIAINGNRLRMQLAQGSSVSQALFTPNGATTSLSANDAQIFLIDVFPPASNLAGDLIWQVFTTAGIAGELNSRDWGVTLLAADAKNDPVTSEAAIIGSVGTLGDITTIALSADLSRAYDRSTVTVNANAVNATNGETMNEILGNGDATNPALEFTLKQNPITYISSPIGAGSVSTLQVWVNNLRWSEVSNFIGSGPADRVFTTSTDPTGKVSVEFGNGSTGGRPPTGQMNIRTKYRKGLGAAGNVAAGQLSMPLDRPQGLRSVANPQAATGGADPDTAADARASAPLQILTIGRVVSLEDYQNFAIAFPGIAKAIANWMWFGSTRGIVLTVSGASGAVFKQTDQIVINLVAALAGAGSPYIPIQIVSYSPVSFQVGANIQIDTTQYDPNLVLTAVWQSLSSTYNFSNRQLGYGVAQSQIIKTIQQIPGVIALELTMFHRQGQSSAPPLPQVLSAASAVNGQEIATGAPLPQGAELLTLDPASQAHLKEAK